MRARTSVLVLIAIVAGVVWWLARRLEIAVGRPERVVTGAMGSGSASTGARSTSPVPASAPRLRRITEDQRREIQALIAEARKQRASSGAGSGGSAAGSDAGMAARQIDLARVSTPVKSALEEAIPILAECYVHTGRKQPQATVMMTLAGDPSVGTLVDPSEMFDHEHKPLDPALDRCLRDTFATLALPPLDEGDKLDIQYSFRFDD